MKQSSLIIFFYCILLLIISSCADQKSITYFQREPGQHDTIPLPPAYVIKIQPGDILSIYVNSLNPAAASFFNPFAGTNVSQDVPNAIGTNFDANSAVRLARNNVPGFIVDDNGEIQYPILGLIKVANLSTSQLRDLLRDKLNNGGYLKEPTVNVQILNFKISVFGEVAKPGSYVIPNERITLPDALSLAGDLTIYGKRTNIMIIREKEGKKEFGYVDLTNREIFSSAYYYLHPNDIVYIEPIKARGAETNRTNVLLPIFFSALSLLIVIFQTFKK